ncbi:MAG TPA: helix-turn-helix domain-containing protein [Pseudonocardiaceae bacterium]|jgi:hypothetical protein|nr:helix-turn-helix domain-containing protein [Pseudonocardiaceae bacterium]
MVELTKGTRIVGDARDALVARLSTEYQAGATIRDLAEQTGPILRMGPQDAHRSRCHPRPRDTANRTATQPHRPTTSLVRLA